jgi:hypothetical protein
MGHNVADIPRQTVKLSVADIPRPPMKVSVWMIDPFKFAVIREPHGNLTFSNISPSHVTIMAVAVWEGGRGVHGGRG